MNMQVIVISGSMGCGKTTVLGEASDVLSEHNITHAAVDLDAIGTVLLPEDAATPLRQRNLAAIFANFESAGISRLLLAEAIETREELVRLRHAMRNAELFVCRLTASLDTMAARLRVREPGMQQAHFVARSRILHDTLEAARLEDCVVSNDGRHITDVAREVLRRAGWIPSH